MMKRIAFAAMLVPLATVIRAEEFSLETLNAGDISVKEEAAGVPELGVAQVEDPQVPQELVNKFTMAKNELWRLNSDTTWLRSDINRLEATARGITQTNTADHFFQSDLRRMSWDMARYNDAVQRMQGEVKDLLALARKDAGLNSIAGNMYWDVNTLLNRAQFDIEGAARNLEWAVRGAKPELIGYNSQWVAMDISRYSRDFTWKLRDLSYDVQDLRSKTQP